MNTKKRNWLVLTTLILTFTLPLLLASYLFWFAPPIQGKTTNVGQLIRPPIPVKQLRPSDSALKPLADKDVLGKWVLMILNPKQCQEPCQKSLYSVRQICKASGKEQTRLRQVLLSFKNSPTDPKLKTLVQREYPKTSEWLIDKERFKTSLGGTINQSLEAEEGAIYMIDPMGNIMMFYSPKTKPAGIFKDLKKLLRVSQIG